MFQIFLIADKLSGRNNITLDNVNFRPDISENLFFKKNQDVKSLRGSLNNLELQYLDKYQI